MGKYALVTLLICRQCRLSDEQMQNITRIAKAALHKGRSPQICTVCDIEKCGFDSFKVEQNR